MKTSHSLISGFQKLTLGLSMALPLFGVWAAQADAQVIRRGPNGREATIDRRVEDGSIVRETTSPRGETRESTVEVDESGNVIRTGPSGNSATVERTTEDGTLTRTTTYPEGESTVTERTLEDGMVIRTTTGPNGETIESVAEIDEDGNVIRTGPNGNSSVTERTTEGGQVIRETTGPRGNVRTRTRDRFRRR